MNGKELDAAREKLGMSQAQLAKELGVSARGYRMWKTGDRPVPGPVAKAVGLMLEQAA